MLCWRGPEEELVDVEESVWLESGNGLVKGWGKQFIQRTQQDTKPQLQAGAAPK